MEKDKKQNTGPQNVDNQKPKSNSFLTRFVCIFVSIVLIFGITFGVIIAIRDSNALVSYEGVIMDEKTTSFFVSYYKSRYIASLTAEGISEACDAPVFWESISESGVSYGELLKKSTEEYLRQLVAANFLFDNYSSFSSSDKKRVDTAVDEVLSYRADGSVEKFNSQVAHYGFDYNSFKNAAKILYKASAARNVLYGENGKGVATDSALCEQYLSGYSHVYMMLIRTETKDEFDENGHYVDTFELTAEEKATRAGYIAEVESYISALGNGGDVQMSPALFKTLSDKYDDFNVNMHTHGYYFHPNASYTRGFVENLYPEVVNTAYSMKVGEYKRVNTDIGVWFIYKAEVQTGAYAISAVADCFDDFYDDAATYSFDIVLTELGKGVNFTEKYSVIDPVVIPYNYAYVPKF